MNNILLNYFRYLVLVVLLLTLSLEAAESNVRLPGHVPTNAMANAVFLENLDATVPVPLTFILPLRNQEVLEELIQRLYDPADQQHYGRYLSSEEFIERFAPTQEDYNKVIAYAEGLGLTVSDTHPNRMLLNVVGPTSSVEAAFKLNLHQYQLPSGRKFYAPNNEPEVPASIASIIRGVVGLDNHAVWRPFYRVKETDEAFDDSNDAHSGPTGGFSPKDLIKAYDLAKVPSNGSGQIVALFELAGYQVSDIEKYTKHYDLPTAKLKNILVDGVSGEGADAEVTLDIELVLALAPESQIYVYEGPNTFKGVLNTYNRIATDNLAKQVSTSWGLGEDLVNKQHLEAENAIFMQMAAQGQSIYAASGDDGAYDDYPSEDLMVDDPASQPYVVGVGGTTLSLEKGTGAYESESVWNNGLGNGAGGGGVSNVWPIPSWQTKVSTVVSKTNRNVPDVALNADPKTGYAIFHKGKWKVFGGTSCGAPLWAAFTALVNQQRVAAQKPVLGFANPSIYAIGDGVAYGADLHDITKGNNLHYDAHAGYDNATGWGSFNGANLFISLTNSSLTAPSSQLLTLLSISLPHTVTVSHGGSSSSAFTNSMIVR